MRKFVSLLAIVAVLAMSAAAFASETVITAIGDPSGGVNAGYSIGAITRGKDATANFYYIKKDDTIGSLKIALSIDHNGGGAANDVLSGDAPILTKATDGTDLEIRWDGNNKVQGSTAGTVQATGNTYDDAISLDQIPEQIVLSRMGFVDGSTTTAVTAPGASFTLTTVPVEVKYTGEGLDLVEGYIDPSLVHEVPLGLGLDGVSGATIVLPKKNLDLAGAISADEDYGKLIDIKVSDDNTLKVSFDAAIPVGTYSFTIVAAEDGDIGGEIVISDDVYDKIDIRGLRVSDDLGKFAFEVKKSKSQELIDDIIANDEELSADIVTAIAAGEHSFLLVMDGSSVVSLNGSSTDLTPLSDDNDSVDMKLAFLAVDASGKLVKWADAPDAIRVVINDDADENKTASFDVWSGNATVTGPIDVVQGVVEFSVGPGSAANGDYTINANAEERALGGGSVSVMEKPATGTTLATQAISVKRSGGYWHSSSSSCSMGFGLVALAGLAALALRKRDK